MAIAALNGTRMRRRTLTVNAILLLVRDFSYSFSTTQNAYRMPRRPNWATSAFFPAAGYSWPAASIRWISGKSNSNSSRLAAPAVDVPGKEPVPPRAEVGPVRAIVRRMRDEPMMRRGVFPGALARCGVGIGQAQLVNHPAGAGPNRRELETISGQ